MTKNQISKNRRRNAKIYPIYKTFSWDLLFFYAIEFLFYTMTKNLSTTEILILSGIYILFKLMMYIPATAISDIFGKRKGIIFGNILWMLALIELIYVPGFLSVLIFNFILALGSTLKSISETNLIYDSVSTKGGDGLYTKLDSQGASWYYILDGIASLMAGYLFVQDNYLPIYIALALIVIATIISFFFKEIYEFKDKSGHAVKQIIKEYKNDLKISIKFMKTSRRMKSYILFGAVFYGIITIFDTYKSDLLVDLQIPEEQFAMLFAIFNFLGGMSIKIIPTLEKKLGNRILTYISLLYIGCYIFVGFLASTVVGNSILPVVLLCYSFSEICSAIWYVLEYKYLKHFTETEFRNRITLGYEFIGCISATIFSIIGGIIVEILDIKNAVLVVGLACFAILVLILDYMRTRFGLKPEEYKKEDIEPIEEKINIGEK